MFFVEDTGKVSDLLLKKYKIQHFLSLKQYNFHLLIIEIAFSAHKRS